MTVTKPISIHAPRTGSDAHYYVKDYRYLNFNPRSPHGERPISSNMDNFDVNFNPRSPHGERRRWEKYINEQYHFNPRSPHGERPSQGNVHERGIVISIHAPRTGSDEEERQARIDAEISIHAPRTGSDARLAWSSSTSRNFNPRSPHGERPVTGTANTTSNKFQSTLPARGATFPGSVAHIPYNISIHAPRTGSDTRLAIISE